MTSTDSISLTSTTSITSSQESQQTSSSWNGREAVQIETDSDAQSSQDTVVNKVESTATTSFTEQTETSNSQFNPFQNVQIGLISGFESIQNAFSEIFKSIHKGISTLTNNFQHVSENKPQPNLNEELTLIQSLPGSLQDVIGSYIDPTETILEMIANKDAIPDYLIHHARHVTSLDFEDRYITCKDLIKVLTYCQNLEFLHLPRYKFSSDDLSFDQTKNELANAIGNLKKLQHLDFSSWFRSTHDITIVTDGMIERIIHEKNLRYLNINYCDKFTFKTFSLIANCQILESLSLVFCDVDKASFSEILKIKTLKELHLLGNKKITTAQLKQLNEFSDLKVLNITNINNVTDEVVEVISECKNIEKLNLTSCKNITNKALESFTKLSSLKVIRLCCNQIDDNGLRHISKITGLKELILRVFKSISENYLSILEPLEDLVYLDIMYCPKINSKSLKSLCTHKKLETLVIDNSQNTYKVRSVLKEKLPGLKIKEWKKLLI